MAQTLLSTSPVASPNSRTTLSSTSVGTPLDFFGHAIQRPPAVVSRRLAGPNRAASARRSGAKASTTSYGDRPARRCTSTSGSGPSSNSGGAPTSRTRLPGTMPSLRGSGVPE
jgi:hypothetical protein